MYWKLWWDKRERERERERERFDRENKLESKINRGKKPSDAKKENVWRLESYIYRVKEEVKEKGKKKQNPGMKKYLKEWKEERKKRLKT